MFCLLIDVVVAFGGGGYIANRCQGLQLLFQHGLVRKQLRLSGVLRCREASALLSLVFQVGVLHLAFVAPQWALSQPGAPNQNYDRAFSFTGPPLCRLIFFVNPIPCPPSHGLTMYSSLLLLRWLSFFPFPVDVGSCRGPNKQPRPRDQALPCFFCMKPSPCACQGHDSLEGLAGHESAEHIL